MITQQSSGTVLRWCTFATILHVDSAMQSITSRGTSRSTTKFRGQSTETYGGFLASPYFDHWLCLHGKAVVFHHVQVTRTRHHSEQFRGSGSEDNSEDSVQQLATLEFILKIAKKSFDFAARPRMTACYLVFA